MKTKENDEEIAKKEVKKDGKRKQIRSKTKTK